MGLNKICTSLKFVRATPSPSKTSLLTGASWVPNTDVYATENGLVIKVELAGMRREDLELIVEGSLLRICGHRPDGCRSPHCRFLVMEINYGAFENVIELPPGYDLGQAKATYQNGFLRVDVPKRPEASTETRSVPIAG